MTDTLLQAPDWPEPAEPLSELVARLLELDGPVDESGDWSEPLWQLLVDSGANRWSLPSEFGGLDCDRTTLIRRYARVAEGSLTAAFILTQHDAAVRRLLAARDREPIADWLRAIAEGRSFTTVGLSQLTTSRRHGAAALKAREVGAGYRLDGAMPWVTGAVRADLIVTGAVMDDGRQMLVALPTNRAGVSVQGAFPLAALQASCTAEVRIEEVEIAPGDILAGPVEDVMSTPGAAGTGGLETSALAMGQARAALLALGQESIHRDEPIEPFEALASSWSDLAQDLLTAASEPGKGVAPGELRRRANALVLRCTQAYLTARKGTGFLRSEPAQRWSRQALFFLVWSCPSPVARASIRDLAGVCS